jgi:hypothetical protein
MTYSVISMITMSDRISPFKKPNDKEIGNHLLYYFAPQA